MSEDVPTVLRALRAQAMICRNMGSPMNGALLDLAAENWLAGGPAKRLMEPWAGLDLKGQFDSAAVLRLMGAWHELALSGDDSAVAHAYKSPDAEPVWTAVRAASVSHYDRLVAFVWHEPADQ